MKRYQRNLAILLALVGAVTSIAHAQLHKSEITQGQINAVDVDTFRFEGSSQKIRLNGFDGPGKHDRNQPESVKRYSDAATHYFVSITHGGLTCGKLLGKSYDRDVRQCWLTTTGQDVAALIVLNGYGVDNPKFSKGRYAQEEAAARAAKRGLWKTESESWIK